MKISQFASSIVLRKDVVLRGILLALIGLLYFGRAFNEYSEPYVTGDGFEYILMTEAFVNHGSVDLRTDDIEKYKSRHSSQEWEKFSKKSYIEDQIAAFKKSTGTFKENQSGFFCNKAGKWYSFHFFFYSIINAPSYAIFADEFGPEKPFYITNALLVTLTCFILLFFSGLSPTNSALATLCFCFSSCYWYLNWQHAEVMTACFAAVSLVFFFTRRNYLSLILMALACLQNQPLILLLAVMALEVVRHKKWNKKAFIYAALCAGIAFIPPLFYLINFGTTNLVAESGFLDNKYVTFNRVTGFFLDLNQGMILTAPLVVLLYFPLYISELILMWKKKLPFDFTILIPVTVIAITMVVCSMRVWHHAMAIIVRYAAWVSIIMMIHLIYMIQRRNQRWSFNALHYLFFTQTVTTLYHSQFALYDYSNYKHTPLAEWVLKIHPDLYDPDPQIFACRTIPNSTLDSAGSPYIFFRGNTPRKILVHKTYVDSLVNLGVSKEDICKIKDNMKYNYGWGYVNMDYFRPSKTNDEIFAMAHEKRILAMISKIKLSPDWAKLVRDQAREWNIDEELHFRNSAIYIINEEDNH